MVTLPSCFLVSLWPQPLSQIVLSFECSPVDHLKKKFQLKALIQDSSAVRAGLCLQQLEHQRSSSLLRRLTPN